MAKTCRKSETGNGATPNESISSYRHREDAEGFDPEDQRGAYGIDIFQDKFEGVWSILDDRKWYTFKRLLTETNKYKEIRSYDDSK
jgi:hypothetical protein